MAVIQTTESAASRLARKLPPDPNAGSAARRLAAKLPPAPTTQQSGPSPYTQPQGPISAAIAGAIRTFAPATGYLADEASRALIRGSIGIPESASGAVQAVGGMMEGVGKLADLAPAVAFDRARMAMQKPGQTAANALFGNQIAPMPMDDTSAAFMQANLVRAEQNPNQLTQIGGAIRQATDPAIDYYGGKKANPAIAPSQMAQAHPFSPSGITSAAFENLPQLAVQMAAAYASGGASVPGRVAGFAGSAFPMELGGAQVAGREGFMQQGMGADEAAQLAAPSSFLQASVNTIIETLSGAGIFSPAQKAAAKMSLYRQALGMMKQGGKAGLTGGVTEYAQEGVNIAGELSSGSNPRAMEGAGTRMAQAGLVGGLMEGVTGATTRASEQTVANWIEDPKPTQQPTNRPQSPVQAQVAPTDTTLDDAAALAEQRLNERYNPAPATDATPSSFTTEKGSTYVFHEDGTTTRNKAARPDHPGESGPQPRSARTWFIRPEDISKLDMVQATTAYPVTIDQYADGRIGVRALGGPDAGKFYRGSMVTPQKAPAVGLIPVESWGNKHTVHFGNPIVSVANPAPVGTPSPADQSASSPTEQGNGDAEYEAAIQAIMAQRAERKAARQDTALQDEAIANIVERQNAARAERAAQATARTAQPPMRRVDRPTAPRVTLDPNAQVPTAPEPRRFTDRIRPEEYRNAGGSRPADQIGRVDDRGGVPAPEGQARPGPLDEPGANGAVEVGVPPMVGNEGAPAGAKPGDVADERAGSVAPREPWQMTRGEWIADRGEAMAKEKGTTAAEELNTVTAGMSFQQRAILAHERAVRAAHAANKPIPPEVLAEYGMTPNPPAKPDGSSQSGATAKDTPKYGIYPQSVKGRGTMFAVRESDNPNGYGDTIHATREEAEKYAKEIEDRDRRNAESRERDRVAQEAKDREEAKRKDERENTRGFADSMPPMQRGKAIASLNALVRVGGEADTIKTHVEKMVSAGGVELATREEPKIKPMSRTEYNRASQREQEAHEKRMKEAGTKTVYTVNGYDLGKTAYDYAKFLQANPQPQGQVAATTNKEPKNGEEVKAPQAQVLNAGAAAPVSAGVVGAKTKPKPGDTAKAERQAEVDAIAPDAELDATGATTTIADIANNVREGKRRYVTARDSENKRIGASMLASVRASVENGMARLREERKKWESRGRATIPQENADGTGTGSTGGVGAARVNRQGAREGQQAEDAGDATEDARRLRGAQGSQGQVTGASESQIRAAKFKAAEDRKQQRKKDATAKGQATKAKYASNPPQFRASDIVKRLIDRAQNYPDLILDEMVQWGEDGALIPISDISTTFVGKLPTELTHEFDAEPQIRSMLRVVPTAGSIVGGNGADWLSKLGVQKYADVLRAKFYSGEGKSRMGVDGALAKLKDFTGQDHGAKFLVWLHDQFKDVGANRPDWTVAKASTLKDGDQFTINGINFEVMPDADENMTVRERGENFEAIDSGAYFFRDALDEIPIDAGTLKQADNTGEVPDIEPEQATTEGDDADAMLGRIKEQLGRGSGRQSADMIRAFQELGSTLVPGVRLQDAEEVGRMYAMLDDGTVTLAEYTNYIDDLRKSGKVAKPEPVAPTPEQATPEKPKFSDSEGVFGQKTESITGSQTSMFGNIAPEVAPDMADRYPGIRRGESVAEYEKRMGTTDTPDMFSGPSSTGGDPRTPFRRPDLNDRISDALGRWSVAARSRFDDYWGKMQRGEILGSGIDPLPYLDLAASFAFRALQSGVTSKSGRKLTAFVEGRMADVRAKWPTLNVTTEEMRKNVRKMLAAANDDKTKIIPAYAEARERLEKARTKEAGKTLGDPRAVREAVASATAERTDVAAKIIDVVKRGIRQGKEAGILTATAQLQPLIDRAKRATQASKRAREMDKIEARGAVESIKAEAEARAEERRGIRAEAVRLVQDTPIAGRGKYLSAVANAKTMKDLSRVLRRLRKDLARSVASSAFKTGQRLSSQFKKLSEDRREIARKALDDIEKGWAAIKVKDVGTARAEELAQGMRTAAELITQQVTDQRRADEVRLHGRRIQMKEHRAQMIEALQKKRVLPRPRAGNKPAEANIFTRNWRRFYDFRTLMNILDDEFTDQGVFAKFRQALSSKRTAELQKNQEFTDRAEAIVKQHGYKSLADFAARTSGAMGEASMEFLPIQLGSRKEIPLGVALDIVSRDPDTKQQMHRGQTFKWHRNDTESFTIDDNKLLQIENALTADQKALAKKINALRSDMQFDRADAVRKELTGNHLVRVNEHYPIVRIREGIDAAETQDFASMGMGEWAIQSLEEAGYWDPRVKNSHPILLGDFFNTQMRSFQRTEMMIQRSQIVKYAKGTVANPEVLSQIQARFGKSVADRLRSVIAEFSGNAAPQSDTRLRKVMSFLARAVTQVSPLTWLRNMSTAIRLPVALVDGKMLGVRRTLRGIAGALASPMKTYRLLMTHSPDLRNRWSHAGGTLSVMPTDGTANVDTDSHFADAGKATIRQLMYAMRDVRNKKGVRNRSLAKPWTALLDSIKIGNAFDAFGAAAAYHAVRADAPKDLSPNMQDRWAARKAADIFYQVANTNDMLNSTEVQESARRNTFVAAITPFTSDLAKMQNLLFKSFYRGPRAQAYTAGVVVAGVAWSALVELMGSLLVGDDEEEAKRRVVTRVQNELVGLVPGGSSMIAPAVEWFMDLESGRGFRGSGILDTPLTGIVRNFESMVRELTKEETDPMEASYRVLRMFDLVGSPLGPSAGLARRAIKNYSE